MTNAMPIYMFNASEAMKHGIEKAVLLYFMRTCLDYTRALKINQNHGYYWDENSLHAFGQLFPFFSKDDIEQWLGELCRDEVILLSEKKSGGLWFTIPSEYAVSTKT